jgi:hypothetical protein
VSFRPPSQANGYCRLWMCDNSFVDVARADRQRIYDAIDLGLEWVECTELFGDTIRVRLSVVHMVCDATVDGIARCDAEDEAKQAHDKLHGDT